MGILYRLHLPDNETDLWGLQIQLRCSREIHKKIFSVICCGIISKRSCLYEDRIFLYKIYAMLRGKLQADVGFNHAIIRMSAIFEIKYKLIFKGCSWKQGRQVHASIHTTSNINSLAYGNVLIKTGLKKQYTIAQHRNSTSGKKYFDYKPSG